MLIVWVGVGAKGSNEGGAVCGNKSAEALVCGRGALSNGSNRAAATEGRLGASSSKRLGSGRCTVVCGDLDILGLRCLATGVGNL